MGILWLVGPLNQPLVNGMKWDQNWEHNCGPNSHPLNIHQHHAYMHAYIDTKGQNFDLKLHHHFDSLRPVADVPIGHFLHCLVNVFMKCSQNYKFAIKKCLRLSLENMHIIIDIEMYSACPTPKYIDVLYSIMLYFTHNLLFLCKSSYTNLAKGIKFMSLVIYIV